MSKKTSKEKWIKAFQFFAGYLVAAWTFLQFVDWILKRYNISPNWVDLLLWLFIGIIPSLLIYLYHRERIHRGQIKLKEKIVIPLNLILLSTVIYFVFGNTDLGATTKKISFENELGQLETKTFTKEEYRIGVPLFGFDQLDKNDTLTNWLRYGIGKILYQDLLQNKNITPEFNFYTNTTTKIREASLFYDFYVDGNFKKTDEKYTINVAIRKANNAKQISEKEFFGENLLKILDDISVYITSEIETKRKNTIEYVDLPIDEFMSSSIPAIKAFANNSYGLAYSIDPYFALAYLEDAKLNIKYNQGKLETQDIIEKASRYKSKLPLQRQLEVLIQQNLINENYAEAEKQIKLQLEVDPNNRFYNGVLFSIFGETRSTDDYFKASEKLFENNLSSVNGNNLANAAMVAGYEKELIDAISAYEIINPEIKAINIEPLLLKGEYQKAKTLFEDFKQSHSNNKNRNQAYDSIFKYVNEIGLNFDKMKSFVGTYRSNVNEQTLEYWIDNDRLIEYPKNQSMRTYVPAGPDAYAGGFIQNKTYYGKLVKDSLGKTIALKKSDYNWNSTFTRLFWKIDNSILKAEKAFSDGNLSLAEQFYMVAIEKNPQHAYLKNVLKHINYRAQNDSLNLLNQYKFHSGNYGPRNFWIENGKFYYKRKSEDINLPKVELLPIADTLYMDLTRLGTLMGFKEQEGKLISSSYSFDIDDFEWKQLQQDSNTFEKNRDK